MTVGCVYVSIIFHTISTVTGSHQCSGSRCFSVSRENGLAAFCESIVAATITLIDHDKRALVTNYSWSLPWSVNNVGIFSVHGKVNHNDTKLGTLFFQSQTFDGMKFKVFCDN